VQVSEIMTAEVAVVRPGTSVKEAAEVMASGGFAALPVVDDRRTVVGIVAEADVLRGRLPQDPRLHLRREDPDGTGAPVPPQLVGEIMTVPVQTVLCTADVADVARLFVDDRLRSVPVVDGDRLVGIVSRRDALRALVRSDDDIARDVHRRLEAYTGSGDPWQVTVTDGAVTLTGPAQPPPGPAGVVDVVPDEDAPVDAATARTLARTVPGVVAVRVQAAQT